ncbi:MAG: metalloregulator ArsR/SmtB family transcription factor [Nitrospiraceae bacterium]|nr:metalloregulator ArsR/SmtB family transcription factor [Nitrospiraceae bacterium]
MKKTVTLYKLLGDETRLRVLTLLTRKELCVCQLVGVLGTSQPLISRNLSLLRNAGFLDERREGKMIIYSMKKKPSEIIFEILKITKKHLNKNRTFINDLGLLRECTEYNKKTGKCSMKEFLEYMKKKRRKNARKT